MKNTIHSLAIYYDEKSKTYSGELRIRQYTPEERTEAPRRGTKEWKEARKNAN